MNGNSGAHCKAAPERPLSGPRGAVALAAVHPYFCRVMLLVSSVLPRLEHLTFPHSPTNTPRFTAFLTFLRAWLARITSCRRPVEKSGLQYN